MKHGKLFMAGLGMLLCIVRSEAKPNFLVVIGDDVGYEAFGCTGSTYAKTPHVDQLAREGVVFDRMYTTVAQCGPSRTELFTGMFPHNTGIYTNKGTQLKDNGHIKNIVDYLKPLGYRVAISGKAAGTGLGGKFEKIEGFQTSAKSRRTDYKLDKIRSFVQETRDSETPFFLVIGSTHAHYPWTAGTPRMDELDQVTIPPQYVDTPKAREALMKHAAEVTEFDRQLGDMRNLLHEEGVQDETIIVFLSEQGLAMPRSKWTAYEKGNRSLVIVHHPKTIKPRRTKALSQYCDVLPTVVELAGGKTPAVDGISFLDVINGKADAHRDNVLIYSVNPSRQWAMITADDWRLMCNPYATADRSIRELFEDPKQGRLFGAVWREWLELAEKDSAVAKKIEHTVHPKEVELYRIDTDYDEAFNLAPNPEYFPKLSELKAALNTMIAAADTGACPPSEVMKKNPSLQSKGVDAYR